MADMTTQIADAIAQSNFQLFQALMQSPKALVMEEPRGPSQLVEVLVSQAGLSRIPFPDVPNLRSTVGQNIIIKGIRLITPSVLPIASVSGFQSAPLTELQKACITIYCEGWEKGQLIPLLILNDMFTEGTGEPYRRNPTKLNNWKNFDWSKTYLQYSNGTATVLPGGNPMAFSFDVEYQKLDTQNNPVIGAS